MRTISYMYQLSGGCNRDHKCGECRDYRLYRDSERVHTCLQHPEQPPLWMENWMACKNFREIPKQVLPLEDLKVEQTSIFDFKEALP